MFSLYFLLNCLFIFSDARIVKARTCPKYTDPVSTKYGAVRGLISDRARIFYGIPYASPPIGYRRWKAPEEPMSLGSNNTFLTVAQPPACPQFCGDPVGACPEVFSEDCLYLNIFTPLQVNKSSSLPVMVFIHGGNFDHGGAAAPLYDGQHLANTTNTIIVVINYRLGALGFLVVDGQEGNLNGNFAILDQRFALKYVQENIVFFGGNPNSVTLFGQSAGAQSIAIHMTSPESANLFHRSIMQSNPFTLPYRDRENAAAVGARLSEILKCGAEDVNVNCLRSQSVDDILAAQLEIASVIDNTNLLQNFEYWGPVIDGTEIAVHPLEAYAQNSFHDKPMIIGSLSEDALPYVYQSLPSAVPSILARTFLTGLFGLIDGLRITNLYPLALLGSDERDTLTDITTDLVFACSSRYAAISAQESSVYFYEFDHAFSFEMAWGANMAYCYGHVCHGGDLPFIFKNAEQFGYQYTPEETVLSESMLYYWTNFAHTGDPNEVGEKSTLSFNPAFTEWPVFTEDELAQLRLATPMNVQLFYYKVDKCDLFDSIGYDKTYSLDILLLNELQSPYENTTTVQTSTN